MVDQPVTWEQGGTRVIVWREVSIMIVSKAGSVPSGKVDYLVVSRNAIRDITGLPVELEFKYLIIDGTNSPYVADRLAKQALGKGIRTHSISEAALEINI